VVTLAEGEKRERAVVLLDGQPQHVGVELDGVFHVADFQVDVSHHVWAAAFLSV